MKKNFLFVLGSIILCFHLAYSQSTYLPGYVIMPNNDTLSGLIEYTSLKSTQNKCTFKADSLSDAIVYKPTDIIGYHFIGLKHFRSKEVQMNTQKTPYFAECLLEGSLNLFMLQGYSFEKRYLIEKEGKLYELSNEEITYTEGGKQYKKHSERYKGTLKYILQDTPELHASIDGLAFRDNALIRLISNYHKATGDYANLQVYYQKNRKAESSWKIQAGISVGTGLEGIKSTGGIKFIGLDINKLGDRLYTAEFSRSDYYKSFGSTRHTATSFPVLPGLKLAFEQNKTHAIQLEAWYKPRRYELESNTLAFNCLSIPILYRRLFNANQRLQPFVTLGIVGRFYQQVEFLDSIRIDYETPVLDDFNNVNMLPSTVYEKRPKNKLGIAYTLGGLVGVGISYMLHPNGNLHLECRGNISYWKDSQTSENQIYSQFEMLQYGVLMQLSYLYCFEL